MLNCYTPFTFTLLYFSYEQQQHCLAIISFRLVVIWLLLYWNDDGWLMCLEAGLAASSSSSRDDSADDHQTALLVGLLSLLALLIAAVTAAFHKRCHQRLRRLLFSIAKTPSTNTDINKTNSYKSSPSGRSTYSVCLSLCLCLCVSVCLFSIVSK